ncbi:MAG: hypothetical protein WCP28_16415 [Actinomycetes bacterium]
MDCGAAAWQNARVLLEEAEQVVAELRSRDVFAHVHRGGIGRLGVRVVLPGGSEAIWDADGAAGLEAQVMADGVLIGFVPVIPGSADFTIEQVVEAISNADYGIGEP